MTSIRENNSVTAKAAAEMEITAAVHAFHAALVDADVESLEAMLCNDLSYGHSNGLVENKSGFIENIQNGKSVYIEIELPNQAINITGDTAIVRHLFVAKTNDGNMYRAIRLNILLVWQKQNEHWKLLARQAVKE